MLDKMKNSLLNIEVNISGDITEPVSIFINKIANALGTVYQPYHIKRIAKAEGEAAIIKAQSEIIVEGLQNRAFNRMIAEETQKQKNIEDITNESISYLTENADATKMDDDWIRNFFDKSRLISDEQMRSLWARMLAGEANQPGSFSKRTVNFVNNLDKIDADLFTKLCGFCWEIGGPAPLICSNSDLI